MSSISVALCTFQGERFLREQLDSLANQSRLPDELIVCDDCSTDATVTIVREFAEISPFPVHIHVNETNGGSTLNFDRAISLCRGHYIALCDQDDVWYPDKLERLEAAMSSSEASGYVFSDARLVAADLSPMAVTLWESMGFDAAVKARYNSDSQLEELLNRTLVTGATMMFRSKYREVLSPIPPASVHDAWIATLLSAIGARGCFVDAALIDYRQHDQQQIGAKVAGFKWLPTRQQVQNRRRLAALRLAWSKALRERLLTCVQQAEVAQSGRDRQSVSDWFEQVIDHLEFRRQATSVARLRAVFREWRSGNYRRFSGGSSAVLLDVLNCCIYHVD